MVKELSRTRPPVNTSADEYIVHHQFIMLIIIVAPGVMSSGYRSVTCRCPVYSQRSTDAVVVTRRCNRLPLMIVSWLLRDCFASCSVLPVCTNHPRSNLELTKRVKSATCCALMCVRYRFAWIAMRWPCRLINTPSIPPSPNIGSVVSNSQPARFQTQQNQFFKHKCIDFSQRPRGDRQWVRTRWLL